MVNKRVIIVETETYKSSLIKLKDPEVIRMVEKKVKKLIENPRIACPMEKQHFGICEIVVTDKYRVYCIKKERAIILFILGLALDHKKNYQKTKEYQKLFSQLNELSKGYDEDYIKNLEKSIS
jgi:putative component of toxin-antitoxin plasmid stabilization module